MFLKSLTAIAFLLIAGPGLSSSLGQPGDGAKQDSILYVKVVSLEGCMATPPTIQLIRETASELDLKVEVEHVIVRTTGEAETHRHIGSPTVQLNGLDIDPEAREIVQYGIT